MAGTADTAPRRLDDAPLAPRRIDVAPVLLHYAASVMRALR